jgi:hypothetical protein
MTTEVSGNGLVPGVAGGGFVRAELPPAFAPVTGAG